MSTIKLFLTTFTFLAALSSSLFAQEEDFCHDILDKALKDYTDVSSLHDYRSAAAQVIQSDNFRTQTQSGGVDITVPIYGVPVSFGGKFSDSDDMKNYYLNNNMQNLSETEAQRIIKSVLSKEAIAAWSKCMADHARLLLGQNVGGEIKQIGQTVTVTLQFASSSPLDQPAVINSTFVSGADIPQGSSYIFKDGTVLRTSVTQGFVRHGNEAVIFIANTSRGSIVKQLDEIILPTPTPTPTPPPIGEFPEVGDFATLHEKEYGWAQELTQNGLPPDMVKVEIDSADQRARTYWDYKIMLSDVQSNADGASDNLSGFLRFHPDISSWKFKLFVPKTPDLGVTPNPNAPQRPRTKWYAQP
jgi:hypothetical protein